MHRFSKTKTVIGKAVLAAMAVAAIGLGVSAARADSWEDDGHWLCDAKGQCIWISDHGWTMPND